MDTIKKKFYARYFKQLNYQSELQLERKNKKVIFRNRTNVRFSSINNN